MSLSPFDSFQSRFVTYLLNFPRTNGARTRGRQVLAYCLGIMHKWFFFICNLLRNEIKGNMAMLKMTTEFYLKPTASR